VNSILIKVVLPKRLSLMEICNCEMLSKAQVGAYLCDAFPVYSELEIGVLCSYCILNVRIFCLGCPRKSGKVWK
jgi:hypothetical protein